MEALEWVSVKSSNIAAVAFEEMVTPPYRRLWVKFAKTGKIVYYDTVPREVYDGMLAAQSKGHYLWEVVRAKGTDSLYAYDYL